MIKDAESRGIGSSPAGYGGALRITEMDSPPGLIIVGEIDEDTYPALVARLNALAVSAGEIHVNLAGMRAIIQLTRAGQDGQAKLVVLHDVPWRLQNVLRIVGWDSTPGLVID